MHPMEFRMRYVRSVANFEVEVECRRLSVNARCSVGFWRLIAATLPSTSGRK